MKFDIFMAMKIHIVIFWVMVLCILIGAISVSEERITSIPSSGFLLGWFQRFRGIYGLHTQDRTLKMEVVCSPEMSSVRQWASEAMVTHIWFP
jgi:hypothetical protein